MAPPQAVVYAAVPLGFYLWVNTVCLPGAAWQAAAMTLAKTALGHQAMKDRSVRLTPRQRSAFILFDGQRSRDQVLAATAGTGVDAADIDAMVAAGLLAESTAEESGFARGTGGAESMGTGPDTGTDAAPAGDHGLPSPAGRTPQQRYTDAYPIATQLTSGLGLRGFRLNLTLEAASGFDDLARLAPRIRDAVGPEKYAPLDRALNG